MAFVETRFEYGFPVVTADSVVDVLCKNLGIIKWQRVAEPAALDDFLQRTGISPEDKEQALKKKSKEEVIVFKHPKENRTVASIRRRGKISVSTCAFLPDSNLMPVVGEFRPGVEEVTLSFPGGGAEDGESLEEAARREFEEETGICLQRVEVLAEQGLPVSARSSTGRHFPYAGFIEEPVKVRQQKFTRNEVVGVVLIAPDDWLALIRKGIVDAVSGATTFFIFSELKRRGAIQ